MPKVATLPTSPAVAGDMPKRRVCKHVGQDGAVDKQVQAVEEDKEPAQRYNKGGYLGGRRPAGK
jgi:hypothetical protein